MKYQQLKDRLLNSGFKFYSGKLNLNFIWERTNDVITNKFTDLLHIAYEDEDNIQRVLTVPCTTKPGLKGSIDSPITHEGVTGTAIIMPGQYGGAWEFRDTDKEFSKNPYFRQIKPIDYWRDGDKDLIVDHVQQQDDKIFGTHWHVMSNKPPAFQSGNVNNWSLGCMGCQYEYWQSVIELTRKSIPLHGKYFTGTIIYTT